MCDMSCPTRLTFPLFRIEVVGFVTSRRRYVTFLLPPLAPPLSRTGNQRITLSTSFNCIYRTFHHYTLT